LQLPDQHFGTPLQATPGLFSRVGKSEGIEEALFLITFRPRHPDFPTPGHTKVSLEDPPAADLSLVNKEYRCAQLGVMLGKVHIVIFTYRPGPSIRLMSFRLATAKESQYYEQNKKK
jgi:hypothetical protein